MIGWYFEFFQMSEDALQDLGSALRHLTVRGNQLKELPDLRPLTGLEGVDLRDNPLLCDCALLPLRRSVRVLTRVLESEKGSFQQLSEPTNVTLYGQ